MANIKLFRVSKVSNFSKGFLGTNELNITLWFIGFKVTLETKIRVSHKYYSTFVNFKK